MFRYSVKELFRLRPNRQISKKYLSNSLIDYVKSLGLLRYRGKRGGNVSMRPTSGGVRLTNLTYPKLSNPPAFKKLSMTLFNARSVRNKTATLYDKVVSDNIDLLAITETWLTQDRDDPIICQLTPEGYKFHNVPRQSQTRGGGVGLLYKSNIGMKFMSQEYKTFENISCTLTSGDCSFMLLIIYRPPSHPGNSNSDFIDELDSVLTDLSSSSKELIVMGDLNLHMEDNVSPESRRLNNLLFSLNLNSLISESTHVAGHCLDNVITRNISAISIDTSITASYISDHHFIDMTMSIKKPEPIRKLVVSRNFRAMDGSAFLQDISALNLQDYVFSEISDAVDTYNSKLGCILDKHAPLSSKTVTVRPNTEWYDQSIHEQKVKRRRPERKAKKTGLPCDYLTLKIQVKHVNCLCDKAKMEYHRNKIIEPKTDTRKLFNTARILLSGKADPVYPTDSPPHALPNKFAEFFKNKVLNIHSSIESGMMQGNLETEDFRVNGIATSNLCSFKDATVEEICNLILRSSNAYCKLDPLPTNLLKHCSSYLTPFITKLINMSLNNAIVPAAMKEAVVKPLLKKSGLDTDEYKNFRPVFNLSFISKICEKVVADQLKKYIGDNDLAETFQSAYRRNHSTETALLRVQNDIMCALDDKKW